MTDQIPHGLTVEHPGLEIGDWRLYAVIRGDPAKENHGWGNGDNVEREIADPGKPKLEDAVSANWAGYMTDYRLRADGRLVLDRYRYFGERRTKEIARAVSGEFWMVLKSAFEGPRMYIPFYDGVIELNRAAWEHEECTGPSAHKFSPGAHPQFPARALLPHEIFPR